ncbi:PDCD5-related protein [Paraphysoderma sedebokerense]|nr:PDCD5-related protein [Paraphysoderma sedebokerense]
MDVAEERRFPSFPSICPAFKPHCFIHFAYQYSISVLQLSMDDSELAAIRARRMAELQGQRGGGGMSLPAGMSPSGGSEEDNEQRKQQMEDMRKTMLLTILDNEARERLSRIEMVKPQKARSVEDLLLNMARSGQLRGKISEKELIDLLENISEGEREKKEVKVVYNRRRFDDSDEEDFDL